MGSSTANANRLEGSNRFVAKANEGDEHQERLKQTIKTKEELSELENFLRWFRHMELSVHELGCLNQESGRERIARKGEQVYLRRLGGAVCGEAYTGKRSFELEHAIGGMGRWRTDGNVILVIVRFER